MAPICTLEECCISASAPLEDILALLKLRGGIVIKGLIDPQDCARIKSELQPYLDAQAPEKVAGIPSSEFFPSTTRKVGALLTNSETVAHKICLNPTILGAAKEILTVRNRLWLADDRPYCRSDPQVNVSITLEIHPGAERQSLHRDDYNFNRILPKVDKWNQGRDLSILSFTAVSPVFPENGGTMWIPGSHLWGETDVKPSYEDALVARMDIGDTFLTFHAGGTNSMKDGDPDSIRTLVGLGFCSGFCRQEENQYLSLDHEKLKKLPVEVQKLAGWYISQPNLGCVNYQHPLVSLGHADAPYDNDAFFESKETSEQYGSKYEPSPAV
ncbi:hypothetical protein P7C73_g1153, partial [Tremellales sp. Uapishka_1]